MPHRSRTATLLKSKSSKTTQALKTQLNNINGNDNENSQQENVEIENEKENNFKSKSNRKRQNNAVDEAQPPKRSKKTPDKTKRKTAQISNNQSDNISSNTNHQIEESSLISSRNAEQFNSAGLGKDVDRVKLTQNMRVGEFFGRLDAN